MNASPIIAQNPENPNPFDASIRVAGAIVRPRKRVDNTPTVELDLGDEGGIKTLTLEAACALAAALQAVAVHQMEQRDEVAA